MSSTTRYIKQELVAHARSRHVVVTSAQFDEWKQRGLLPEPEPESDGRRGRPRLLYPEPAPDAVIWLGMHRRFIDGDESARFWMWLEGFDYLHVDPAAIVRARLQAVWRDFQRDLPSLPALDQVAERGPTDDERDTFLDALDEAARNARPGVADNTTLLAALFGMLPGEAVASSPADDESVADGLAPILARIELETGRWSASLRTVVPLLLRTGTFAAVYREIVNETVRWDMLRAVWLAYTPEWLRTAAPLFSMATIQRLMAQFASRADLMRLFKYEPLAPVLVAALVSSFVSSQSPPAR